MFKRSISALALLTSSLSIGYGASYHSGGGYYGGATGGGSAAAGGSYSASESLHSRRMHEQRMHDRLHANRVHHRLHYEELKRRPSVSALEDYRREVGDFNATEGGDVLYEREEPVDGRYSDGSWAGHYHHPRFRESVRMHDIRVHGQASAAMRQELSSLKRELMQAEARLEVLRQQLRDLGVEPRA